MNKKVYIIIINFNKYNDTIECLDSILKSDYPIFQVIVVDNCSSNDSINQMIKWAKYKKIPHKFYLDNDIINKNIKPKKSDETLIFIQSESNNGFSAGNNLGLKFGLNKNDGDYFWLLNNDTSIFKDSLKELVNTMVSNNNIGITGSKLLFYDNREVIQSLGNDNISWKGIGHGSYDGMKDSPDICQELEMKSIVGASLLIKKEVIEKIGLMDENYFLQHEESDWCINASKKGFKLVVNCRSAVLHKEGASSDRKRNIKKFFGRSISSTTISDYLMWGYYSIRNEIYFVRKNFPNKFIQYLLFILPIKIFIKSVLILILNDDHKKYRFYLLIRAIYDGLTGKSGKTIDPYEWKKKFS